MRFEDYLHKEIYLNHSKDQARMRRMNNRVMTREQQRIKNSNIKFVAAVCFAVLILLVFISFFTPDEAKEENEHLPMEHVTAAISMKIPEQSIEKPVVIVEEVEEPVEEVVEEPIIPETIAVTGENRDKITTMLAKLMYGEARGIKSITEQACVAWTVLNRVDDGQGNIKRVITEPEQFCYSSYFRTVDDYGRDLKALAEDIILRWEREHAGESDVGRVLPKEYLFFYGDGKHNWFRIEFDDYSHPWDYSLPSPYEN